MEVSLPGDNHAYSSMLEDIKGHTLVLDLPVDENHVKLTVEPGTVISCKVFDGRCFYKFNTAYRDGGEDDIPVWYVDMPARVQKIQYREFVRVKTNQTVVVRPIRSDGTIEPMIITSTQDLSGSGICFLLNRPLALDSKVSVELDNVPDIGLIQIMSKVVRCVEVSVNGEIKYQIAAEYVSVNRKVQDKLVKLIFCLQRDGLAKGIDDL